MKYKDFQNAYTFYNSLSQGPIRMPLNQNTVEWRCFKIKKVESTDTFYRKNASCKISVLFLQSTQEPQVLETQQQ